MPGPIASGPSKRDHALKATEQALQLRVDLRLSFATKSGKAGAEPARD